MKTKKIQIEIYPEKAGQFFLSLFQHKISEKPNLENLRALADAIHFDAESLINSLNYPETRQQQINEKLLSIHKYLFEARHDSADYLKVGKETFEQFRESPFCKDLYDYFVFVELSKWWLGKEESAEVKSAAAIMTLAFSEAMSGLSGLNDQLKQETNKAANRLQEVEMKPGKNGTLLLVAGKESVELDLFIEKNGLIQKKKIRRSIEKAEAGAKIVFLKTGNNALRIKENADSYEVSHYENIKEKNSKLELSEAVIKESITFSKQHPLQPELIKTKEGGYLIRAKNPQALEQAAQAKDNNYQESDTGKLQFPKEFENLTQSPAEMFNHIEAVLARFFKLPRNHHEKISARNSVIISIYKLLKEHYNLSSSHSYAVIAGYIGSCIGYIDTQKIHDETNRTQPYRKYLKDTVTNILASHSLL